MSRWTTWPVEIAAVLVMAVVVAPRASCAQVPEFLQLLETYTRGDLPTATRALADWPEARVQAAGRALAANLTVAQAKAAAMLHTEAAFELYPERRAFIHLELARSAIARLRPSACRADSRAPCDPSANGFIARWHGLVAIYQASHHDSSNARHELNQARAMAADNPDIELLDGAILEVSIQLSEPNVRGAWSSFDTGTLQNDLLAIVPAYERVVKRHPESVEARLRLGWALHLARSSSTRVRAELAFVAERATRSDLRYLAHMFLGAVEERDHRADDAMREYEAAHAAEANQSSFVALVGMASARGLADRVGQLASEFARVAVPGRTDPWVAYNAGFTGGGLLDGLRADVRGP